MVNSPSPADLKPDLELEFYPYEYSSEYNGAEEAPTGAGMAAAIPRYYCDPMYMEVSGPSPTPGAIVPLPEPPVHAQQYLGPGQTIGQHPYYAPAPHQLQIHTGPIPYTQPGFSPAHGPPGPQGPLGPPGPLGPVPSAHGGVYVLSPENAPSEGTFSRTSSKSSPICTASPPDARIKKATPPRSNRPKEPARTSASDIFVSEDNDGIVWIKFEYTRNRVNWLYRIRCDVASVDESQLSDDFKMENCVYPRAMGSNYQSNRRKYETECNHLGWRLAYLNPDLCNKRGLIQRAVDSYRNSSGDMSVRSRRVRKLARAGADNEKR